MERPLTVAEVLEFESWPKEKQDLARRVIAGKVWYVDPPFPSSNETEATDDNTD